MINALPKHRKINRYFIFSALTILWFAITASAQTSFESIWRDLEKAEHLYREAECANDEFNDQESAIRLYRQSAQLFERHGKRIRAAEVRISIADLLHEMVLLDEALALALDVRDVLRPHRGISLARVERVLSYIFADLNLVDEGFSAARRSAQYAKEVGDVNHAHSTLSFTVSIATGAGRPEEAERLMAEAEAMAYASKDQSTIAKHLYTKAHKAYREKRYTDSLNDYRKALKIFEAIDNEVYTVFSNLSLGAVLSRIGKPMEGIRHMDLAYPYLKRTQDRYLGIFYLNRGEVYRKLGEHERAFRDFKMAERLTVEEQLLNPTASVLLQMGDLLSLAGDVDGAAVHFDRAVEIFSEINNTGSLMDTAIKASQLHHQHQRPQKALEIVERALAIEQGYPKPAVRAELFTIKGALLSDRGDHQEAHCYLATALTLVEENPKPDLQGRIYHQLARTALRQNRSEAALADIWRALMLMRQVHDRYHEASTLHTLAHIHDHRGDLDLAIDANALAIDLLEELRTYAMFHLRMQSFARAQDVYDFQTELMMRRADTETFEALAANERAKARNLLDLLRMSDQDWRVDPKLRKQRQTLIDELNLLIVQLDGELENKAKPELKRRIDELLIEMGQLENTLRETQPLTVSAALSKENLAQLLPDEQTVILAYGLGERQSYAWTVQRRSGLLDIQPYRLPARHQIEVLVAKAYEHLNARNRLVKFETPVERNLRIRKADEQYPIAALELSRILVEPMMPLLNQKRVVLIADEVLQLLPFAALPHPNASSDESWRPLIEDLELVQAPSLAVYHALVEDRREKQHKNLVAVFADPVYDAEDDRYRQSPIAGYQPSTADEHETRGPSYNDDWDRLPATRLEAQKVMSISHPESLAAVDFEASRDQVLQQDLSNYRIIHFATHALVDDRRPELSGLVLSKYDEQGAPVQGFLSLSDIRGLQINADMVVLSACRTALGTNIRGEGLVGLSHGFFYAGAKSVMASFWNVADVATAELMSRFYQYHFQEGMTTSAALRRAQLELRNIPKWRSPYYWGGFHIQGAGAFQ